MKVYLVPGLGFDRRMFQKLNFSNYEVQFLDWIEPLKNESISAYAKRLAEPIYDNEKTILIGHSFGGIISQEIAVFKKIEKIILISSIKSELENPLQFRILAPFGLHRLFNKEISNATLKYWGSSYDYAAGEEQDLFKSMIGKQSNHYLQWALKQISIWKKPISENETPTIQIHGTNDKNFPIGLIKEPFYKIENGGHFMAYNMPGLIDQILREELEIISDNLYQ